MLALKTIRKFNMLKSQIYGCLLFIYIYISSALSTEMAQFSVDDVIQYAKIHPEIYQMEYLESNAGKQHIQQVIDAINNGKWPQNGSFKEAWFKPTSKAGYNMSLVADYVSKEYSNVLLDEKIIKKLQELGLISSPRKVQTILPKDSQHTDRIIFIKDSKSCKLVAKIFKEISQYKDENEKLPSEDMYLKAVNELRIKCGMKLPLIIEYKGSTVEGGQGIILVTRAKGKSLEEISNKINEIDDGRIISIFKSIGNQLGRLDSLFYKNNDKKILIHPDTKLANFTYHEKEDQLYWIDTSGLSFQERYPTLNSFSFVNNQLRNFIIYGNKKDKWNSYIYVPFYFMNYPKIDAENFYISAKKHFLALRSLYEGYGSALKQNRLDLTPLIQEYESTFESQINVNGSQAPFRIRVEDMNKEFKKRDSEPINLNDYKTLNIE